METAALALRNIAPASASASEAEAEETTIGMKELMASTAPFREADPKRLMIVRL